MATYKIFDTPENQPFKEVAQVYSEDEVKEFIEKNMDMKNPRLIETSNNGFAMRGDILVQKIETFIVR